MKELARVLFFEKNHFPKHIVIWVMIMIYIQGYSGKTGSEVYRLFQEKGLEVRGIDEYHPFPSIIKQEKSVIIDFSTPAATEKAVEIALKYGFPMIIGTTGIEEEKIREWDLKAKEKEIGIYLLENYLPSLQCLQSFLKQVEIFFPSISIEETHHESKKDAPSGTAKMLRRCINQKKVVPIKSNRVKIYTYEHTIHLQNENEEIVLTHRCFSKRAYAWGVWEAFQTIHSFIGVHRIMEVRKNGDESI